MARTPNSPERDALRREVEGNVLAEVERAGLDGISVRGLARRFAGRGTSEKTVTRWIDVVLKSGRAGQHLALKARAAADTRAALPDPAASLADDVRAALPVLVSPSDIACHGGVIDAIGYIRHCIHVALRVIEHAQAPGGGVRMAKTMLAASEHLRRCLETSARISETMRNIGELEAFHKRIIEEIAKESPPTAERIMARLSILAQEHGA
ncbi:hypothetical protein [Neoroseomonas lacus]|uniref:Uncharacterized protein n=1 Tax=Neoroseomonas lacus TaxID=287609 RepID=A0A917NRV2_9PROT|nr:hypothetical protein [Neoroseomonas lacus]GGJ22673.1 hypothetical protein GCM10011320_32400 [Neoroseomonas lacus]